MYIPLLHSPRLRCEFFLNIYFEHEKFFFWRFGKGREMRKRRGNGKGTFPTPFRGSGRKVREENLNLFEHEKFFYDSSSSMRWGKGGK